MLNLLIWCIKLLKCLKFIILLLFYRFGFGFDLIHINIQRKRCWSFFGSEPPDEVESVESHPRSLCDVPFQETEFLWSLFSFCPPSLFSSLPPSCRALTLPGQLASPHWSTSLFCSPTHEVCSPLPLPPFQRLCLWWFLTLSLFSVKFKPFHHFCSIQKCISVTVTAHWASPRIGTATVVFPSRCQFPRQASYPLASAAFPRFW